MSEPRIISVFNSKGGSGKTTLSMLIAGTLGSWGHETLVVDADPQGTAYRWSRGPTGDGAFPARAIRAGDDRPVHESVRDAVAGGEWDYVIIDCPPSIESPAPQSALMVSDLALVPVLPTPGDVWAVHGALELAESVRREVNKLLVAGLVPNQMVRTNVAETAYETIQQIAEQHSVYTLAPMSRRTAIQEASALGRIPGDLGRRGSEPKIDAERLTEEVLNVL